jgi:hypothetical protein
MKDEILFSNILNKRSPLNILDWPLNHLHTELIIYRGKGHDDFLIWPGLLLTLTQAGNGISNTKLYYWTIQDNMRKCDMARKGIPQDWASLNQVRFGFP